MKRFLKQILFGSIFLGILFGLFFIFYKIFNKKPDPIPVVTIKAKQIKVLWTKNKGVKENQYNVVAEIENLNNSLGTSFFSYEFIFYDKDNKEIKKEKGESYIMPGEKKYILGMFLEVEGEPLAVDLKIDNDNIKWQKAEIQNVFSILEKNYNNYPDFKISGTYHDVSGIVVNQSGYDFRDVEICVVMYDSFGNLVDINKTGVNNLLSKESRFFKAGWYYKLYNTVNKYDIKVNTNLLDTDNLLIRKGETDLLIE